MPAASGLFTLSNRFGGLLSRPVAHLIGPNRAQAMSNANLDNGSIQAQAGVGSTVQTLSAGTYPSIYKFGGAWVNDSNAKTVNWQYVEFAGLLIRVAASNTPQASSDGVTWYNLGVTAPTALTAAAGAAGNPNGTYTYYVTYVSALGGESAPSAGTTVALANQKGSLSNIPTSLSQVRKIYRTGGTLTTINLIATLNATDTTYTDDASDATASTGTVLSSTNYSTPGQLEWIAAAPYGVLFAGIGKNVYYCEPALPQAWPTGNVLTFNESTVAGAAFSGAMIVATGSTLYAIDGNTASQFSVTGIPTQQGCSARDTLVDMGDALFYRSPDGICAFTGRDVEVISKLALADSLIGTSTVASNTGIKAVRYNERYILFVQSGTSFSSGGYVEWDKRVDGNWKTGTITATAVHYNRTDDALYVVQGSNLVKQWEAGSTVAGSYTTGEWVEQTYTLLKHWKQGAIDHSGDITVDVVVDGTTVVSGQALSQGSTVGRSRFRFPAGVRGRAIHIKVNWANSWTGKVVEVLDNVQRKASQL